jgi:nucleoside-diphosphate-sugar epimerase
MKLFVTGGTGFIGTHFLIQALAAGHDIVALRRPGSQSRLPLQIQPKWVEGALDQDCSAALNGCDVLVHLAAHTPNPPYASLDECLYWNVFAPIKLAHQAAAAGVRKFLVAGSCFEYGQVPVDVEYIDTNTPLAPTLSYPTSKAAASIAFDGLAREHGYSVKLLRIFQVYGEGEQSSRLWPSLRRAALAGEDFPMSAGEQVRDFIAVEDVANQFMKHLNFDDCTPGNLRIRHAASGTSQTLLAFASYWWSRWAATGLLLPGQLPYRKNELFRLVPNPRSCD